jgi:Pin2-interacting protein X1
MAYVNELSGSKLRSKLGATLNESASAPSSSFAQRQLEKMGWSSGEGLGKHRQGMASHIKVKKREDEVGLGHVKPEFVQHQNQWWNDSMGSVLAKLSGKKQKTATDEDLYNATGGARFGMRAQRKQTGKWARTETISEEDEEEAKSKVEWNGQGQAKIMLKETLKRKKSDEPSDKEMDNGTLEVVQPKKKKKLKQTVTNKEEALSTSEKDKKERRKKDKKAKKDKNEKKKPKE